MRLKKNKDDSFFHPFEIAFCGFPKSGKTTLIDKLIAKLSDELDVGFFNTEEDKSCDLKQIDIQIKMTDMDILFIESHHLSDFPKFVFISKDDNYDKIIDHIDKNEITEIVGVISEETLDPFDGKYPFFNREEINKINSFILEYFHKKIPKNIKGLILTGGKSERMEEDKGSISYHSELSQVEYTKNLLTGICSEVFISCREDQKDLPHLKDHNLLFDSFPSVGPTTGILSAQFFDPTATWIVLACDLPYLDKMTVVDLLNHRNPFKNATCFLSAKNKLPEPLCAIYEPKSYIKLMQYFSIKRPCPRKVLINSNIKSLSLMNESALDNVNTPQEKEMALAAIHTTGENHAN